MTGHDYERVVAAYLKNKGYNRVEVTKGSGDYGVDVIAHKGKKKYAVQCKYYTSPVSLGAVQEVIAGKAMYNCNAAMVVTNSTFTEAAEKLAKQNGVKLISGVKSSGHSIKDFLTFIGVVGIVFIAVLIIGSAATVIDTVTGQFKTGDYAHAILNIFEYLLLLAVLVGIPIGIKLLLKYRKMQMKNKVIQEPILPEKQCNIPNEKPYGFNKYLNLSDSDSGSKPQNIPTPKKSRDEILAELKKLRENDFDTYIHLYEYLKPFLADGYISAPAIQRRLQFGYARASRLMDILKSLGFISQDLRSKLLVTEQEIISILAEIEN